MKTKAHSWFFGMGIVFASLAAHGQKLYPVQGPASSQTPAAGYPGKIRRPMFSSGGLPKLLKSWELPNGEVATGKCVVISFSSLNARSVGTPDSYPPQSNLAFAWDAVYGPGYSTAHLLGNSVYQGIFRGDQGTILQVEIIGDSRSGNDFKGVAVDNRGNLYKLTW